MDSVLKRPGQPGGSPLSTGSPRRYVALVVLVLVAAAFELVTAGGGWVLAVFMAVAVLALVAQRSSSRYGRQVLTAVAVASSVGTTILLSSQTGMLVGSFGLGEAVALVALLMIRWRCDERLSDRLLSCAVAVAVVVLPLRVPNSDTLTFVLLLAVVAAVAVAVAAALREQDAAHRLTLAAVRRSERDEIARELHDVVAHHVTGIVVTTQALRAVSADQMPPAAGSALAAIESAGSDALRAMRRLVDVLRQPPSAETVAPVEAAAAGVAAVGELVARFGSAAPTVTVELSVADDVPTSLPPELAHAVYRVAQESLTNVSRHAGGACSVKVSLGCVDEGLVLEVGSRPWRARPRAVSAGRDGGYGLVGMRERVEALGGAFSAGPHEQGGWTVRAALPLLGAGTVTR